MTSIILNSISGLTYPYDVYVCDVYGNNCGYIAQINTNVPSPLEIVLPIPFNLAPSVGIKIITSDGCERFKIIDCIHASDSFISVWGPIEPITIELPYELSGTYTGTIDWGDGTTSPNTYANRFHTYSTSGIFTVTITGTIIGWSFNYSLSSEWISSIQQWGSLRLGNSGYYFAGCINLDLSSVYDVVDLTGTSDLTRMFDFCTSLTTINNINNWDLSNVTSLNSMFNSCFDFNDEINNWNVSGVTDLSFMFSNTSFNNPIGNWNVGNVTNMEGLFSLCPFNQPLSGWNVSNVQIMGTMFSSSSFNQPIGNWDISNVFFMDGMFDNNPSFDQNIGDWNISGVTSFFNFMFGKTPATFSTTNLDNIYNGWVTKNPQIGINITFGSAKYTSAGLASRNILSGTYGWTIVDGGM